MRRRSHGAVVVLQPIVGDAQQEAEEQGNLRASAWYVSPREPRRGSPLPVHLSEARDHASPSAIYKYTRHMFWQR